MVVFVWSANIRHYCSATQGLLLCIGDNNLRLMSDKIQIGDPAIEVKLRRSSRAKRYSLRVSNADGSVSLTLPQFVGLRAAKKFTERQEGWLRSALAKRPQQQNLTYGKMIPFEGKPLLIRPSVQRSVQITETAVSVPGKPETVGAKLAGFLKVRARERLALASEEYAAKLGKHVSRITLRDTRSRWGSCTEAGNLMFSWRLIMAPPEVLRYVAAHEVAHLVEMNHSKAFWQVVEGLDSDYEDSRRWLRSEGTGLHAYRF